MSSVDGHGASPVQADKGPSQWRCEHSNVGELGSLWVLEVGEGEIEEVDNLQQQGPAKV